MIKKLLHFLSFGLFLSWALFVSASATMAATYIYDANGNLTSDGNMCYTYNDANKLSVVQNCVDSKLVAEYTYDHEGSRIMKKIYDSSGALFKTVYSPTKFFEQVKLASNGATLNTTYYYSNNELVAKKNPDGTKNYFLNDHLNSTTVVTDQSGQVVERTTYNPYGEITSGGTQSKYQYTGQENDPESGLDFYQARYYSPQLKHFTQPDSIIPDIYNPQTLNRYAYVNNNPMTYNDPTGHCTFVDLICNIVQHYFVRNVIELPETIKGVQHASEISTQVKQDAIDQFGTTNELSGGRADAWRHARWNERVVKESNFQAALIAGIAHEAQNLWDQEQSGQNLQWEDAKMDSYNNVVSAFGVKNGKTPDQLLKENKLIYNTDCSMFGCNKGRAGGPYK